MKYELEHINLLIEKLRSTQNFFLKEYEVEDIFSNSKFYEIIIANQLNHIPIPGHSGSRDAIDEYKSLYEYKHFKKTSSNHTWTFNDFSDNLISHMHKYKFIFSHINDLNYAYPGIMDWYYEVPGKIIQEYLEGATQKIRNKRKMINVSPSQLERLGLSKIYPDINKISNYQGRFQKQLLEISEVSYKLEKLTGVTKILTSNKLYELLVALYLGHKVNSENGGYEGSHDAEDDFGKTYEYKVYKSNLWNFQDISDTVLDKYLLDEKIILATVDKSNLIVQNIYSISPKDAVNLLYIKRNEKARKAAQKGLEVRRLQISLSLKEISQMESFEIIKGYLSNSIDKKA